MNASTYPQFPSSSGQHIAQRKNHVLRNLSLILLVQILVTIGLFIYQRNLQPEVEATALLDFNIDTIDKWIISDASNKVVLTKSSNGWQLPNLHLLPVDSQKLDDLLDKLKGTKLTWPATTTEASHERFEVTDTRFQRRLEFFAGDKKLGDIFLGGSPGFKKVYLRRAGDKEVFAVELSSFEFTVVNKDWLDRALLVAKQPVEIHGVDFTLIKEGENWRFADGIFAKVDASKVNALTEAIGGFTVQDVNADKLEGEKTSISVKTLAGEWQYEFVKTTAGYVVKRNDRDLYFNISAYEYERLAQIKKQDLVLSEASQSNNANSATSSK